MSRFKRFAHSLASGYVLLGANILYTFASVPLALHYLSKDEFALWSLGAQIMGYVLLIDAGMSGSISRILIDYKGHQTKQEYGSVIQTGALVGAVQGALIALAGGILSLAIAPVLKIPAEFRHEFIWLLIGQAGIMGVAFALRIFSHVLASHQRYDITNYTASVLFAVNYLVMWYFFAHGAGVFSILWSQAIGIAVSNAMNIWGCIRLKLLPQRGEWGKPSRQRFSELFHFGKDVFLFSLGSQLVNASQIALLTRLVGLETATIWTVCTRTYSVLVQVICKIFDYSSAALAEMMVHGERDLLRNRFREITIVSMSLSVVMAAGFAVCNGAFVSVWTAGKVIWSPLNDGLLAVWLISTVCVRTHTGLVGQTKVFGFLRYVYFFEGVVFISLTLLLREWRGISTMLLISIGCSFLFTVPYSLRRTRQYFGMSWSDLASWHRGPLRLALYLAPLAVAMWFVTRGLPDVWRLILNGSSVSLVAAWMFLRHGMSEYLQTRLVQLCPGWARGWLTRIMLPTRNPAVH